MEADIKENNNNKLLSPLNRIRHISIHKKLLKNTSKDINDEITPKKIHHNNGLSYNSDSFNSNILLFSNKKDMQKERKIFQYLRKSNNNIFNKDLNNEKNNSKKRELSSDIILNQKPKKKCFPNRDRYNYYNKIMKASNSLFFGRNDFPLEKIESIKTEPKIDNKVKKNKKLLKRKLDKEKSNNHLTEFKKDINGGNKNLSNSENKNKNINSIKRKYKNNKGNKNINKTITENENNENILIKNSIETNVDIKQENNNIIISYAENTKNENENNIKLKTKNSNFNNPLILKSPNSKKNEENTLKDITKENNNEHKRNLKFIKKYNDKSDYNKNSNSRNINKDLNENFQKNKTIYEFKTDNSVQLKWMFFNSIDKLKDDKPKENKNDNENNNILSTDKKFNENKNNDIHKNSKEINLKSKTEKKKNDSKINKNNKHKNIIKEDDKNNKYLSSVENNLFNININEKTKKEDNINKNPSNKYNNNKHNEIIQNNKFKTIYGKNNNNKEKNKSTNESSIKINNKINNSNSNNILTNEVSDKKFNNKKNSINNIKSNQKDNKTQIKNNTENNNIINNNNNIKSQYRNQINTIKSVKININKNESLKQEKKELIDNNNKNNIEILNDKNLNKIKKNIINEENTYSVNTNINNNINNNTTSRNKRFSEKILKNSKSYSNIDFTKKRLNSYDNVFNNNNNLNNNLNNTNSKEEISKTQSSKEKRMNYLNGCSESILANGPKVQCPICHKLIESHLIKIHINSHPTQIFNWMYLGNLSNAFDVEELNRLNIKYILNCGIECKNDKLPKDRIELHLKIKDEPNFDIIPFFEESNKFINKAKLSGEKILIHCQLGISRSVTLIIAYLIKYQGFDFNSAFNFIKNKRNQIRPNQGFIDKLKQYEKLVNNNRQNKK